MERALLWSLVDIPLLLLLASGVSKLVNIESFSSIVAQYGLLPNRFVGAFTRTLPIVEVIAGLLSVFQCFPYWSLFASGALYVVFAAAMAINLRGDRRSLLPCGCFISSSTERTISWKLVTRNVAYAGLLFGASLASTAYLGARQYDAESVGVPILLACLTMLLAYSSLHLRRLSLAAASNRAGS